MSRVLEVRAAAAVDPLAARHLKDGGGALRFEDDRRTPNAIRRRRGGGGGGDGDGDESARASGAP